MMERIRRRRGCARRADRGGPVCARTQETLGQLKLRAGFLLRDGCRRCEWLIVLVVLGLVGSGALDAQESPRSPSSASSTAPTPLTHYMGREIAMTMHFQGAGWLTRDSRQREEDSRTMLKQLGLKPGMTVCDMGCGNGFYTLRMAELVGPEGKVFAVDIQPEMLRLMEARAAEKGLKNIVSVLGTQIDPKLPADQVDVILCVDVYHEFAYPEQMLAGMRTALRPETGVVVLVEFRMEDPEVPIRRLHKMSKKQIMKEWPANDFKLVREFDELPWQHMMFFGRDRDAGRVDSSKP